MSTKMAGPARDRYLELVREFPLTRIETDKDLKAAQRVMDDILARGRLGRGEGAYLDTLSELALVYENLHHPIPAPSDAAMLAHLMEARGVSQTELHHATKIPLSTISQILSGKRRFAKKTIATLAEYFGVDKGLFAANF